MPTAVKRERTLPGAVRGVMATTSHTPRGSLLVQPVGDLLRHRLAFRVRERLSPFAF